MTGVLRRLWPLFVIPGLIFVVLVIHVILADGAASSKHERVESAIVAVQSSIVPVVDTCDRDCGSDTAMDLVTCILALFTGLVFLMPLVLQFRDRASLGPIFLVPAAGRRPPPAPQLNQLSINRA